jgi:predicted NBD/HSP70 family sugar kinase
MSPTERPPSGLTAAVAPSLLREMNQRLLLDLLFRSGPATRPQLAREAGLSQPTVFAALSDLDKAGLVRPAGRPEVSSGRPAVLYEANPAAGSVVGVDIGRNWLHLVLADLAGEELARLDVRNTARTSMKLVEQVSRAVQKLTAGAGLAVEDVTHTVVGSPGVLDAPRGRVRYAGNLPGWQRPGLAEALEGKLGASLTIDNDANLAALGEYTFGSARQAQQFAYLHIGTGVGLGLVIDGKLYRGFNGSAGEVGYLPILGEAPVAEPEWPQRGVLEMALAADAVVRYATEAGMTGDISAEDVFVAARNGDPAAQDAVLAEARVLARLVTSICAFFDPELVVVGGGIGQNFAQLEPAMRDELARFTPMRPQMTAGDLGADAVVRGAIATGIHAAREIVFSRHLAGTTGSEDGNGQ